ncbi:uncharacterized protein [Hyperolius riggenbachi]|uniref:uncharacterized protein isoform X2 n=1 Tax=Hyperolius riggenbachi TaxID=752182 RepID=UPI0035A3AD5C
MPPPVTFLGDSFLIDRLLGLTSQHEKKDMHDLPSNTENLEETYSATGFMMSHPEDKVDNNCSGEKVKQKMESNKKERKNFTIFTEEEKSKISRQSAVGMRSDAKIGEGCQLKENTVYLNSKGYEEKNNIFEKPNQSYIALISQAILSSPEKRLQLSDIYQWIMDTYPYYHNQNKSWRNSVRHNLSLNECFIKVGRSDNGKGYYWTVHPANVEAFSRGEYQRRRTRRRIRRTSSVIGCQLRMPLCNLLCNNQSWCIWCTSLYTPSSSNQLWPLQENVMENVQQPSHRSLDVPFHWTWYQLHPYL